MLTTQGKALAPIAQEEMDMVNLFIQALSIQQSVMLVAGFTSSMEML